MTLKKSEGEIEEKWFKTNGKIKISEEKLCINSSTSGSPSGEDTIQQAINCQYPNCNRRTQRYNGKWKNYFCSIHQMQLQQNRGLVNFKKIAETISLTIQEQKKKFEGIIESINREFPEVHRVLKQKLEEMN